VITSEWSRYICESQSHFGHSPFCYYIFVEPQLLQTGGGNDKQVREALDMIGDYYADRFVHWVTDALGACAW
jgi:hypothetical protein